MYLPCKGVANVPAVQLGQCELEKAQEERILGRKDLGGAGGQCPSGSCVGEDVKPPDSRGEVI